MAFEVRFRALTTDLSQVKAARAGMTKHFAVWLTEFMESLRDEIREYPGEAVGFTEHKQARRAWNRRQGFKRSAEFKRLAALYPEDVADFDTDAGRPPRYKPYKRTYTLFRSWYIPPVKLNPSGMRVVLHNSAGADKKRNVTDILGRTSLRGHYYADYVQGSHQQPYHKATGWINVPQHIKARNYHRRFAKDAQLMLNDIYLQQWWKEGRKKPHGIWGSRFSIRSHFLNPHYNVGTVYGGV